MGQRIAALLPRIDNAPADYQVFAADGRGLMLARTLTELGIADPRDWQQNTPAFLLKTLEGWIDGHDGGAVRDRFYLCAALRGHPGSYGGERENSARLYLAIEAVEAGYVLIGPTLERLNTVHPKLPATFYRLIIGALGRWIRTYDYTDALERVEMWKEWIEGEENPEQYEFPDVEAVVPPEIKRQPLDGNVLKPLMSEIEDREARRLIEAAIGLDKISHQLETPEISTEIRESLMDSNPALPGLLVSFKRQDAIVACFEEEAQTMLEAEPEPCFLAEMDPGSAAIVRQSFDALAALCETLAAASRLIAALPGNNEMEH